MDCEEGNAGKLLVLLATTTLLIVPMRGSPPVTVSRLSIGTIVVILLEKQRATISTDSLIYDPISRQESHGEKVAVLGDRVIFASAGMPRAIVNLSDGTQVRVDADQLARSVFEEVTTINPKATSIEVALAYREQQKQQFGRLVVKGWRAIQQYMKEDGGLLDAAFVGVDPDGKARIMAIHFKVQVNGDQATISAPTQEIVRNAMGVQPWAFGHPELLLEIRDSGGASHPKLSNRPGIRALLENVAPDPVVAAEDLVRLVLENQEPEWHVGPPIHTYQVTALGVTKLR